MQPASRISPAAAARRRERLVLPQGRQHGAEDRRGRHADRQPHRHGPVLQVGPRHDQRHAKGGRPDVFDLIAPESTRNSTGLVSSGSAGLPTPISRTVRPIQFLPSLVRRPRRGQIFHGGDVHQRNTGGLFVSRGILATGHPDNHVPAAHQDQIGMNDIERLPRAYNNPHRDKGAVPQSRKMSSGLNTFGLRRELPRLCAIIADTRNRRKGIGSVWFYRRSTRLYLAFASGNFLTSSAAISLTLRSA